MPIVVLQTALQARESASTLAAGMDYLKCVCTDCEQEIEYPTELGGQVVDCPSCSRQLILPAAEPKRPKGLVSGIFAKLKEARQHATGKKEFKGQLLSAVSDGVLSEEELDNLFRRREEFQLTDADIREWAPEVYRAAVTGAKRRGHINEQMSADLDKIREYLRLHPYEIQSISNEIARSRHLSRLQQGNLTPIVVPNLILNQEETAYWVEGGKLYEQKVVSRRYEGGSRGTSIRLMKGVNFRIGAHSGQMVSETGWVPVSVGQLVITDQRIIFQGDSKSFAAKFEKILEVQPAMDGIRFSESNRQKPRAVSYDHPNGDFVCEVLSYLMERRSSS